MYSLEAIQEIYKNYAEETLIEDQAIRFLLRVVYELTEEIESMQAKREKNEQT